MKYTIFSTTDCTIHIFDKCGQRRSGWSSDALRPWLSAADMEEKEFRPERRTLDPKKSRTPRCPLHARGSYTGLFSHSSRNGSERSAKHQNKPPPKSQASVWTRIATKRVHRQKIGRGTQHRPPVPGTPVGHTFIQGTADVTPCALLSISIQARKRGFSHIAARPIAFRFVGIDTTASHVFVCGSKHSHVCNRWPPS